MFHEAVHTAAPNEGSACAETAKPTQSESTVWPLSDHGPNWSFCERVSR